MTTSPSSIPSSVPLLIVTSRRNSDDSRAITSAAAVLYAKPLRSWRTPVSSSFSRWVFEEPQVLGREPLVLAAKGGVVGVQPVDLRDRLEDPGDALGDAVDRALDRPEREADGALELANERVRREAPSSRASSASSAMNTMDRRRAVRDASSELMAIEA